MATVNSERVLNYLKEHYGEELTKAQISEALDITIIEDEPATETRKAKTHKVLYHTLTEAGLAYDPVAEEAQKAAEKEAAKAARAAERAAKKAAKEAAKE